MCRAKLKETKMIKKLFLIALAFLLIYGIAEATNIPTLVDPKNYPTVWTELVYNGNTSNAATIYSGYVVEWDFDSSDSDAGTVYDDTCPWVKKANAANDIWTAGVVEFGQDIPYQSVGRIIIRGPAVTLMGLNIYTATCTVNTVVSSTASGYVADEATAEDTASLGICIKASAAAVDIGGQASTDFALIFVDPTHEGD